LPILKEVAKNRDGSQAADFIEGFKVFDKEQNGTIGSAELRHLLGTLGVFHIYLGARGGEFLCGCV